MSYYTSYYKVHDGVVNENDSNATVKISRTGNTSYRERVYLKEYSDSARDYSDYRFNSQWVTFERGQTEANVRLNLIDDSSIEGDEKFRIHGYQYSNYYTERDWNNNNCFSDTSYVRWADRDGYITIKDDDPVVKPPGITRTIDATTVSEGGSKASFTYKLDSRPWDDVVITLSNSDDTEVELNKTRLVFTADNWNQAQTVVATGLSDRLVDGTQQAVISHQITSKDFDYAPRQDGTGGVSLSNVVLSNLDADRNPTIYGDRGYTYNDVITSSDFYEPGKTGDGNDRVYSGYGRDQVWGGYGNDRIMGGYDDDVLHGDQGNDQLYGEYGDDRLFGGAGNDLIDGGQGADYMSGGAGNDTYYVDNSGDVIDDKGSASDEDTIILQNSVRFKLNRNIENATGSSGGDTLTGNGSANELVGNGGSDTLIGAAKSDTLIGGAGNDKLVGGSGADDITGGAGNDRLIGSGGSDTLNGGSGKDTYVLQRGSGFDVIEHFTNADQVTVKGFNDDRVSVVEKGGDALLYAKSDLLARVVDGAGMNII